jgi:hypothetical protein
MSTAAHPAAPASPPVSVVQVTRRVSPRLVYCFVWEGITGIYLLPARVPMVSRASKLKALTKARGHRRSEARENCTTAERRIP